MARALIDTSVSPSGELTIDMEGFPIIRVDPAEYTADCRRQAMAHGFKQKYVDAAALGKDATPAEKYAAITAIREHHLNGGAWNRTGGGDGTGGDSLLVKGIMAAFGLDRDTAREQVTGWDKKTQAAMRAIPEIKAAIDAAKAADDKRAGSGVDTSAAMAALRAMAKA